MAFDTIALIQEYEVSSMARKIRKSTNTTIYDLLNAQNNDTTEAVKSCTHVCADFADIKGEIKPIHGVGGGPVGGRFRTNKVKEFRQAHIPYSRLHDPEGQMGSGEFVNIHCIFKNFDADADDPASYNFEATDLYLKYILEAGTKVFYRLGETIENHCEILRSHTFVPKDYMKWAQICEHIIRHYNEGWANGYHMNIEYWEIWNEPEGAPDTSPNWSGTPEQYFELYRVTANHLKACFPHLKIGGYASTGFYEFGREVEQFSHSYMYKFFDYITAPETKAPIDFFTWHFYGTDVERAQYEIEQSVELLKKYNLSHIENIIDEWNYMECWAPTEGLIRKSSIGAAFVSAMHTMMQKSPLSKSMYYDAEVSRVAFCGLFNEYTAECERPYYSFYSFGHLYMLGKEVLCSDDKDGIYTLAATNGNEHAVILTNYATDDTTCTLELKNVGAGKAVEIRMIDDDRIFEKIVSFKASGEVSEIELEMPTNSIAFITLK